MTVIEDAAPHFSTRTGVIRTIIGLLQGLALFFLFDAGQSKSWPATDGPLFAALYVSAIFVPIVVVTAVEQLRPVLLTGWALTVALLCAGLGYYDIVRDPLSAPTVSRIFPSAQLWFALSVGLFIGHSLLISGATEHRLFARYSTYFGVSWKYGVQIAMAVLFAAVFWLVLWLGADLFRLIKIELPSQIIRKNWFWIPATTIVLNIALHITDVRIGIVRGVRSLSCNLLSWLLPLLTIIAIAFVSALPFTGLEPLWNTRRASSILLIAAASLIFLINLAYRDGAPNNEEKTAATRSASRLLHWSMTAASIVLIPLVALASYGNFLRVQQYGLTPARIVAAASAVVGICYSMGYALAALDQRSRFSLLERTNIATAFVMLAILLALFTPLADPARLAVADQIRRLNAGILTPDKLDYAFLRFGSGHYGTDALRRLAEQTALPVAATRAAESLQRKTRYEMQRPPIQAPREQRIANITLAYPPGQSLPASFIDMDWSAHSRPFLLPPCIRQNAKCDAVLADIDGDGAAEIILVPSPAGMSTVFKTNNSGSWFYIGSLAHSACPGTRDALLAGRFETAAPFFKDIVISGYRMSIIFSGDCTANSAITIQSK